MRRNVLALKIIYCKTVKILSKYCKNASIIEAFFVFLEQKLFRMKKITIKMKII
jgi:hypothetical protein